MCTTDFIYFHQKRNSQEMGADEICSYLSYLAIDKNVAASTQNIALSALLFLYRRVLKLELPNIDGIEQARRPKRFRLPIVLTHREVKEILALVEETEGLFLKLLYGTGLLFWCRAIAFLNC